MAEEREDIIAKIKALRARASDEASSEAEVEAAARRAAKLIQQHEISEDDLLERGSSGIAEGKHNHRRRTRHPALDAATRGIAAVTHCQLLVGAYYKGALIWVGQPPDVEFAIYLSELVQASSERSYRDHRKSFRRKPSPHWRRSFLQGFGMGVSERLIMIERERRAERDHNAKTGTSLCVVKEHIIASYMDQKHPDIGEEKRRKGREADYLAAFMGMQAAADLNVSSPLCDKKQRAAPVQSVAAQEGGDA